MENVKKINLVLVVLIIVLIIATGTFVGLMLKKNNEEKVITLESEISNNTTNETELSSSKALEIGNEMYSKVEKAYNSWRENNIEDDKVPWKVRAIYVEENKDLFTIKGFNQFIEYWQLKKYNDERGEYYTFEGGYGGNPRFLSEELEVLKITEEKITYKVTAKYEDNQKPISEYEFVLVRENNNWLTDSFTLPY